jgi:predicted MPP superfamily phosphohydrolase
VGAGVALAAGAAAWGWFEAGWVRLRTLETRVRGLPAELDGMRIVHLSDFHLGFPSRSGRAIEAGVEWARQRDPELVAITGDLLSRPGGEARLRALVARLPRCYAVLGNHDYADSRDPFSQPAAVDELGTATLLRDESRVVEVRGQRVQIAGVDPKTYRRGQSLPEPLADRDTDFRILLCHYPHVVDRLTPGAFHLVLAGHLHAGQIAVPYGAGKVRFSQLRWTYVEGAYERPAATLHVSPGLGTTFVPFRFFARPEATELVLKVAD